jgi:hypothetical protein
MVAEIRGSQSVVVGHSLIFLHTELLSELKYLGSIRVSSQVKATKTTPPILFRSMVG